MKFPDKIKQSLNTFFFKENFQNYDFLYFFRISIGVLTLIHFISIWDDFQLLFGKHGVIPSDIQSIMLPDFIITLPKFITFFESYGINESSTLSIFQYSFILLCLTLTFGLFTRISAISLLILQILYLKGAGTFNYGIDNYTTMSLFYLVIFPSGHFKSLDNLIFKNRKPINITPFLRLFQLHVVISYFFSGLGKSLGINWWNGEAMWKAMHLPEANLTFQFNLNWLADYSFLLVILGCAVLALETLYPFFIWFKKTRKIWLISIILFHLGIALLLDLFFFAGMMIIWNVTAFYFVDSPKKTINST